MVESRAADRLAARRAAGHAPPRVTCTYDWTRLTDEKRLPRARATTAGKLRASLDRLAALAEGS